MTLPKNPHSQGGGAEVKIVELPCGIEHDLLEIAVGPVYSRDDYGMTDGPLLVVYYEIEQAVHSGY
jgi:hypothetical protein